MGPSPIGFLTITPLADAGLSDLTIIATGLGPTGLPGPPDCPITFLIMLKKAGGGIFGGPPLNLFAKGPFPLSRMARKSMAGGAGAGPTRRTIILPPNGGIGGLPRPGLTSIVSVFSMRTEFGPLGCDTSTFYLRMVTFESGAKPVPIGGSCYRCSVGCCDVGEVGGFDATTTDGFSLLIFLMMTDRETTGGGGMEVEGGLTRGMDEFLPGRRVIAGAATFLTVGGKVVLFATQPPSYFFLIAS